MKYEAGEDDGGESAAGPQEPALQVIVLVSWNRRFIPCRTPTSPSQILGLAH